MISLETRYRRIKDCLKDGTFPVPFMSRVQLKDGTELEDITPYSIVERIDREAEDHPRTLQLLYLDRDRKAQRVNVNHIAGLSVTDGKGVYQGELMVEFHYFYPTLDGDFDEITARQLLVEDIYYGVHPNHEKYLESKDFYLKGQDSTHAKKPVTERERNFPLWRLGVYGNTWEVAQFFKSLL